MLIGLLLAGQHTSSTTSSWLGFFLAKHPDIQVSPVTYTYVFYKLLLDLVAETQHMQCRCQWTVAVACLSCSQPAQVSDLHYETRRGQSASTLPQPAGWLPEFTAAEVQAYMHALLEKCHLFRNNDPYRHMSCTWSSRVCVQNFAVVRCGV